MSTNPVTSALKDLDVEVSFSLDLDEAEKALLIPMAEPGAPLWKIIKSMVDYADQLKIALVEADLTDPVQINAARKVQATIVAAAWVKETFNAALTPSEKETK